MKVSAASVLRALTLLALLAPAASATTPAFAGEAAPAPAAETKPADPKAASADALSAEEVDKVVMTLVTSDGDARAQALKTLESANAEAVPAFAKKLAELRKSSGVPAALKAAREGSGKNAEIDLYESLVRARGDGAGYRTALSTAAILRALAKIGTTPAAREIVKVAGDHGGALRPEVARLLKALGDRAIPALIETRKDASSELRHWSFNQLEAMGKRIPGDAVQTKDNEVLADVLRAYASVHDMDAVPVILSFVNSDRIQVRSAARDALGKYGTDAIWKLREAFANVTGKPAPEGLPAAEVAKQLFAAYDRLRLQEVYGLLEEGLKAEKEGHLEDAVAAFDKVLARQPMLDRRGEMVPAYFAYGQKIEDADPVKAIAVFRKAARLWPESPRTPLIEAEIAYLEGKELLGRGIADVEPFKRALTLDPGHAKARAELERLDANVNEHETRLRSFAAAGAVVLVALVGIILFGGRRTRRVARA